MTLYNPNCQISVTAERASRIRQCIQDAKERAKDHGSDETRVFRRLAWHQGESDDRWLDDDEGDSREQQDTGNHGG